MKSIRNLTFGVLGVAALSGFAVLNFDMPRETLHIAPPLLTQAPLLPDTGAPQIKEEPPAPPPLFPYMRVIDSCGPYYEGVCVNMRSGPGIEYPIVDKLRNGLVLRVAEIVSKNGEEWLKIKIDKEIRYPERITSDWYVAANVVELFYDEGDRVFAEGEGKSVKRIIVDISEQMLYAYDGEELFMEEAISTGHEITPTPRGTFTVYYMTPSRYMQGPLPNIADQYYDLPGVPWNLYFTKQGAVIHGAYWHNNFGSRWSHGCVNLPSEKAEELYAWARPGAQVTVQD